MIKWLEEITVTEVRTCGWLRRNERRWRARLPCSSLPRLPQPEGVSWWFASMCAGEESHLSPPPPPLFRPLACAQVESQNYYHFHDNRVLPSHVDEALANKEGEHYQ